MKHLKIIKDINLYFKNNYSRTKIKYDSQEEMLGKEPYIFIKYIPRGSEYRYLGANGRATIGIFRVHVYNINPTKVMEDLDYFDELLSEKNIGDISFSNGQIFSGAERETNGDLFTTMIDFDVCLLNR